MVKKKRGGNHEGPEIPENLSKYIKIGKIDPKKVRTRFTDTINNYDKILKNKKDEYEHKDKEVLKDRENKQNWHIKNRDYNFKLFTYILAGINYYIGSALSKIWTGFLFIVEKIIGPFSRLFKDIIFGIFGFLKSLLVNNNPLVRLLVFILVVLFIIGMLFAFGYNFFTLPVLPSNLGFPNISNNINAPSIQSKLSGLFSNNFSINNNTYYNNIVSSFKNAYQQSIFSPNYINNNSIQRDTLDTGGRCNDTTHVIGSDLIGDKSTNSITKLNTIYDINNADPAKTYSILKPNNITWSLSPSSYNNFNNLPPEFINNLKLNDKLNITYPYTINNQGAYILKINDAYYSDKDGNKISSQTGTLNSAENPLVNIDDSTCKLNN